MFQISMFFFPKMTGDQVIALNLLCLIFGITIDIALLIVVARSRYKRR